MENKGLWAFGTREVVYGAIGAALYGVFSWATNIFPLPAAGNITFRPAVAVLVFFGVAYGPWVGLLAGFIGNTLGDMLWLGVLLALESGQWHHGLVGRPGNADDQRLPRAC